LKEGKMKKIVYNLQIAFAILMFASFAFAQKSEVEIVPQCDAQLARSLVETQISDSKTVEATDKQIKILIRAADFLWQFEETAARKHFSDALDLARERFKEKGVEAKGNGRFTERQDDFRFQVLTAIAKRDAVWANKLTDAVLEDIKASRQGGENAERGRSDDETNRLLEIASSLLKSNKSAAFQFAGRAAGFPFDENSGRWHSFLYRAAEVDQSQADALYSELLTRRGGANIKIKALYFLSGYPFGNSGNYGVNNSMVGSSVPASFVPNPNLQRQYLNVLIGETLALKPNAEAQKNESQMPEALVAFSILQDLETIVVGRFSDLQPRLVAAKAHANSLMTAEYASTLEEWRKGNEKARSSFDKKIERLEKKVDSKGLDAEIVNLIFAAETDEQMIKATDWMSKIGEEAVRESATNYLWFKRAELAVKENRLPDAEKHAEKVSELEHRAIIYFKIAEAKLKQENLKEPAAAVLETTVRAALKAPNGVERAQVLLGTAFFFEKYNQYRAAEVLSEAVKTINRLENPDLSASSIYRKIEGKDFGYYTSISTPGYSLEKSFAQVSQKDFQSALNQARNLDDKYLRTLAVIAVVGDCIEAQEKTPEKPKAKPNQPKPAAKKPTPKQNSD
jgi:hypothetical protein